MLSSYREKMRWGRGWLYINDFSGAIFRRTAFSRPHTLSFTPKQQAVTYLQQLLFNLALPSLHRFIHAAHLMI